MVLFALCSSSRDFSDSYKTWTLSADLLSLFPGQYSHLQPSWTPTQYFLELGRLASSSMPSSPALSTAVRATDVTSTTGSLSVVHCHCEWHKALSGSLSLHNLGPTCCLVLHLGEDAQEPSHFTTFPLSFLPLHPVSFIFILSVSLWIHFLELTLAQWYLFSLMIDVLRSGGASLCWCKTIGFNTLHSIACQGARFAVIA